MTDVPELARLCSPNREDESYWRARIEGYMSLEFNPHQATPERLIYVALHKEIIIGFIAGHLTKRTDYPGQIQWIMTAEQCRRTGVGSELLWILTGWFIDNNIKSVRVDIDPEKESAQEFYRYHHVSSINKYWLYWDDIRLVLNNREASNSRNDLNDF
jgi:GNAT superfamily N-acetyltransferase